MRVLSLRLSHIVWRSCFINQGRAISEQSYIFPTVREEDLEESFVFPEGEEERVNVTRSCVLLRHKPSNFIVKVYESPNVQVNRTAARRQIRDMLDEKINGLHCFRLQKEREEELLRARKETQMAKRREKKESFNRIYEEWKAKQQEKQNAKKP